MIPNRMVLDLSHHNTITDWAAIQAAGVVGVVHKATEGHDYIDPTYLERRKLALAEGLLWGAYHFLQPGDMAVQAEHFIEAARYDGQTLLAADHEVTGVPLVDLQNFLEEVYVRSGQHAVIYSGHLLKEQLGELTDTPLANYRLWLAHYSSEPTWPPAWERPWLWQHTDKGGCPGVSGYVDENAYERTEAELVAEWVWFAAVPQVA